MIDLSNPVPIHLQLYDNNNDAQVRAQVLKPTLETMIEVELQNVGNGMYMNNSVLMPDIPFLIVNYVVFENGKESENYARASDVFYLNPQTEKIKEVVGTFFDAYVPQKNDYLVGIVFESYQKDEFLEGKVVLNGTKTKNTK
jgi:hypothetical protein